MANQLAKYRRPNALLPGAYLDPVSPTLSERAGSAAYRWLEPYIGNRFAQGAADVTEFGADLVPGMSMMDANRKFAETGETPSWYDRGMMAAETIPGVKPARNALRAALRLTPRPMSARSLHEIGESNFTTPYTIDALEHVPISSLTGSHYRPERVGPLAEELRSSGWLEPLVVDKAGNLIEGQHRYRALQELGVENVPVHRLRELLPEGQVRSITEAARGAGVHQDQASQIARQIAEIIDKEGVGELELYDAPRGFEKAWDAAVAAARK